MKIAILVAGNSKYFPPFFDKPKCLYHVNGEVQLEKVIKVATQIVDEQDIIVVAGYKFQYVKDYLDKTHPDIELKINDRYSEPAIYSFRKAIENVDDDIVFMFGDENISLHNVQRISQSTRKMALLCHDYFYYYSLGIFKLRKDCFYLFMDNNYLSWDYIKKIYCFANNKAKYDDCFNINSGICIGYMIIDLVRRIGGIIKVENPVQTYTGTDIDFLHYNPDLEYIPDIDYYEDTDEYQNETFIKMFYIITKTIKLPSRIMRRFLKIMRENTIRNV